MDQKQYQEMVSQVAKGIVQDAFGMEKSASVGKVVGAIKGLGGGAAKLGRGAWNVARGHNVRDGKKNLDYTLQHRALNEGAVATAKKKLKQAGAQRLRLFGGAAVGAGAGAAALQHRSRKRQQAAMEQAMMEQGYDLGKYASAPAKAGAAAGFAAKARERISAMAANIGAAGSGTTTKVKALSPATKAGLVAAGLVVPAALGYGAYKSHKKKKADQFAQAHQFGQIEQTASSQYEAAQLVKQAAMEAFNEADAAEREALQSYGYGRMVKLASELDAADLTEQEVVECTNSAVAACAKAEEMANTAIEVLAEAEQLEEEAAIALEDAGLTEGEVVTEEQAETMEVVAECLEYTNAIKEEAMEVLAAAEEIEAEGVEMLNALATAGYISEEDLG